MSALDGSPISVTAIAKTVVVLATINFSRHSVDTPERSTRNALVEELRRHLSNYVRSSLDQRMESLVKEAEFGRYRSAVGSIVITTLSLLSFYTLASSRQAHF